MVPHQGAKKQDSKASSHMLRNILVQGGEWASLSAISSDSRVEELSAVNTNMEAQPTKT
jgi:hypothetical protein